jgi:transcriptional regulator with XRE-family HTH domain
VFNVSLKSIEVYAMNLEEYRALCGWPKNELARRARIDINTLNRAMDGELITVNTAYKLAKALSQELGRPIRYQDIDGLNVKT